MSLPLRGRMVLLKCASGPSMVCGVPILIAFAAIDTRGQTTTPVINPVLRLEKPKYLLGESIRFRVGVETDGSGSIPHDLKKPCSL
jgi:hypothetical protein